MKSNLYKKDLVSAKFAGELSGYSSRYLRRLAREGKIEGVQVGRVWMVKRGSLVRFLDTQTKRKAELSQSRSQVHAAEYNAHRKTKEAPKPEAEAEKTAEKIEKAEKTAEKIEEKVAEKIVWETFPQSLTLSAVSLLLIVSAFTSGLASKLADVSLQSLQTAAAITAPVLSAPEKIALGTYNTLNGLFDSIGRVFAPAPTILVVSNPPPIVVATSSSTISNSQLSISNQFPISNLKPTPPTATPPAPAPIVSNSYPTYVTNVSGVSQAKLDQSLVDLRSGLLSQV